jgi:FMN-dependent NADH-azoreductase
MSSILLVTASPRPESVSTKVAHELVQKLQAQDPAATLVHRDIGAAPLPHIDGLFAVGSKKPAEQRTPEEVQSAQLSDALTAELLAADTLVLATGLINFNIYSSLKAWIDNVARAGLTFRYTENGPVGLATGKKAYIVLASGGVYSDGPAAPYNHAVPYLKTVLGFIGITDVEVVYVEGLALGPDAADKAFASAQEQIAALAA